MPSVYFYTQVCGGRERERNRGIDRVSADRGREGESQEKKEKERKKDR